MELKSIERDLKTVEAAINRLSKYYAKNKGSRSFKEIRKICRWGWDARDRIIKIMRTV